MLSMNWTELIPFFHLIYAKNLCCHFWLCAATQKILAIAKKIALPSIPSQLVCLCWRLWVMVTQLLMSSKCWSVTHWAQMWCSCGATR